MQYEDLDKQLRALHREERDLNRQKRNIEWIPLIPPVQKGWKRFFVLREDVAVSRDADFFENLLAKINTYDWSHRKDFMVKYRRYGRKKYKVKTQKLLEPCPWKFRRLGLTDAEKAFFDVRYYVDKKGNHYKYYVFSQPWRFVLRVRPNMITMIEKIDSATDARMKEIDNYLKRTDMRKRQARMIYGRYNGWWSECERPKEKNPLKNKPIYRTLDELKE